MKKEYEITIIFPVLNEKDNLNVLIPKFSKELENYVSNYELLVIDDNSQDGTDLLIKDLQKTNKNLSYYKRSSEKSLPMSIFEGTQLAKYQNVCWLDADGSMHIDALKSLIDEHEANQSSVVVGSRFAEGGGYKGITDLNNISFFKVLLNLRKSNDTVIGMVLSNIFNKFLVRFFNTEVKDITSGFVIVDKKYLAIDFFNSAIYGEYFIYMISNFVKNKIKIIETGYICETRLFGESKTAPSLKVLFIRGIAYIKAAIICRRDLNENK